jgi:phage terminase large subunit-like protein
VNWAAGNVEVHENADGLIKPVKPRGAAKIDPIVALAMSMGTHCKRSEEPTEVWDESPLIWLGGDVTR